MYSNCCCSCSFEPEIIKIGQSSHKMYNNNILNFQVSMTNLNACTKRSGNLLKGPRINQITSPQTGCGTKSIFNGVLIFLIQSFPSPRLVVVPKLNSPLCPTIYPDGYSAFSKALLEPHHQIV